MLSYLTCSDTLWLFSVFPVILFLSLSLLPMLITYLLFSTFCPCMAPCFSQLSLPMESDLLCTLFSISNPFTNLMLLPSVIHSALFAKHFNLPLEHSAHFLDLQENSRLRTLLPLSTTQGVFTFPPITGPPEWDISSFPLLQLLLSLSLEAPRSQRYISYALLRPMSYPSFLGVPFSFTVNLICK